MKETPCDTPITPETFGLKISQVQDAAISYRFTMNTLKRVFRLSEESITEAYMQVSLNPDSDNGMSAFNTVLLYLYLTGRASYRLTNKAQVKFLDKREPLTIPEDVDTRYVIARLRKVARLPRKINNILYPICDQILYGSALEKRKNLLRIQVDLCNDLRRVDYAEIDRNLHLASFWRQKKRARIPRATLHAVLDVVRLVGFHSPTVSLEDIKTSIKGGETRRKKVLETLGFPLINIDVSTPSGAVLYKGLHLNRC